MEADPLSEERFELLIFDVLHGLDEWLLADEPAEQWERSDGHAPHDGGEPTEGG